MEQIQETLRHGRRMRKTPLRTVEEVEDMQRRIDKGILLTQQRLVKRYTREEYKMIVFRNGRVTELSPQQATIIEV